jgi:O-antigen/teichoic acid export membrane protein
MYAFILKIIKEDNFLSLAGNLVLATLGFAGFALLARGLDTESFAKWVLFISGGSLVEMLRFGITNNALIRFLSGANTGAKEQLIGSNVLISIVVTVLIALLLVSSNHFFYATIHNSGYSLFFKWYPILIFFNLPWNNALIVLQAKMEYGKILLIKTINSGLFFLVLILNTMVLNLPVTQLVLLLILVNLLTSSVCVFKNWDGLRLVRKASIATNKTLLNFGKYSTFTLIGTNLLRNADILIISISPLGSTAVAIFSIPLKLTELQQIPLRSFTATAFPKMSKASMAGRVKEVRNLFNIYSGALTYLFFFISMLAFVFAKEFVILISGFQYLDQEINGFNIIALVQILSVYGLLLPIDRMTGIALDSINKPKINALKVIVMLSTNIIGDVIAVFIFESLEMVAVATLIFTGVGIGLGSYFLNKEFTVSVIEIFNCANRFYQNLWNKMSTHTNEFKLFKK